MLLTKSSRSRSEAIAATPRLSENWSSSGGSPPQTVRPQGFQTSESFKGPVENSRPSSLTRNRTPSNPYETFSGSGNVYGLPTAGLGHFDGYPCMVGQYTSNQDHRGQYGVPFLANGSQHRTPEVFGGADQVSRSADNPKISLPIRPIGQTRPPPGFKQ
jgi:hypothetical protein